jgi:hypothetical protein
MSGGIRGEFDGEWPEPTRITHGPLEEGHNGRFVERLHFQDGRPAGQCGVHRVPGVFGRGADQGDPATFDVSEQDILLASAEAVDLVEEENRSSALVAESAIRGGEDFADANNADLSRILPLEVSAESTGDQQRQCGLASSGRTVEEQGADDSGVEHSSQHLALAEEVFLAQKIFNVLGAQSVRQRLCRPSSKVPTVFPEILHPEILSVETARGRPVPRI